MQKQNPEETGRKSGFSIKNSLQNLEAVIHEYPGQFWLVVGASFIDRLGGAMLFPFFTLYLTRKFGINMTSVGVLFGLFSLSSVLGMTVGGALTDRIGRKRMLIMGLVMSALSSLLMGVIERIDLFVAAVFLVGVLADAAGPAQQALIADLVPEEKRASGFGILRVIYNLAVVIGPLIGGLLAVYNYLYLFIADAVTSLITATIMYFSLQETWTPKVEEGKPQESMAQTFKDYGKVLRDSVFTWFLLASTLMVLVYIQMNTTLAVYLRDVHGIDERGFSYILALNAGMVVLLQFPITRRIEKYRPLIVMAAGTLLYAIGFAMYGFVSLFVLFLLAMVIITFGEMFVSPVGQAIVSRMAPEEMRGRYMAAFGFSWVIPFAIGPILAGLIMDNMNPDVLWYSSGILGLIAAGAFYVLEMRVSRSRYDIVEQRLKILERLEEGDIAADEAADLLDKIGQGAWARLANEEKLVEPRNLRIRVSDLNSGLLKVDLRLPIGLVNTVLYTGGTFSLDMDAVEENHLRELMRKKQHGELEQNEESNGRRTEISIE